MKKFVFFLIITALVLQILNVFFTNTIASESMEVARIQSEIEKIEEKNIALKTELLTYLSITHLASRAAELGFTDSRKFITINSPLPFAVNSSRAVTE